MAYQVPFTVAWLTSRSASSTSSSDALAVKVWAFVDALIRPAAGYVAAEKLTKPAWLLILGLTVLTSLLWRSPLGLFSIVGTVAAFVYILDVKPAIAAAFPLAEAARAHDLVESRRAIGKIVLKP